ncbi:hypothetical protein ACHAXA_007864 [Cyclostephanos tholiformis]|uniref:Fe2OG dioxygenase domain-containing protein n=1 Tax=Cyclostephanos tholiformis TaxID=382380 RepID=A0ABD3R7U5_9STRA
MMTATTGTYHGILTALLLILATSVIRVVESFSVSTDFQNGVHTSHPQHHLIFPIRPNPIGDNMARSEIDIGHSLSSAFGALVGSSEFMIKSSGASTSGHQLSSCRMPDFGESATVTFSPRPSTCDGNGNPTEYILFALDFDRPTEDFGMLCLELYRHRAYIRRVVCIKDLESNVLDFLNGQPPDSGIDAEFTSSEAIGDEKFGSTLKQQLDSDALAKLQKDGFVVIDNVIKTSQSSHEKLDGKTNRGKRNANARDYRTDKVAFLSRENAEEYGLEDQHDFLLTLASHLNGNLDFSLRGLSPHKAIFPGTIERPLTNPKGCGVQFAEYGENDYYRPHSDNSKINMRGVFDCRRSNGEPTTTDSNETLLPYRQLNWRYITAILYMNEGWEKGDGGQLRLYLDSLCVIHPDAVIGRHEFIDINPSNGKLLLFDSRMIHSVEKVLSEGKIRRALTLWIIRPEENGVTGEDYVLIDDDGGRKEQ